jgi:uncharacterized repeat protein (TIGR01451 family)
VRKEEEVQSRLELRKSNDSVGDETPGNEVVYTLEVTALDGPVDDVTVTDLPPEGFAYVAGSGEGAPFIHEYASPGIWDLGDMAKGETKTLTYRILHLINNGIPAENILAITFTNKAAAEMRERLHGMLGEHRMMPMIKTFHGLGVYILRTFYREAGIRKEFVIMDTTDTTGYSNTAN